jgi:hypothetical protein
MSTAIEVKKKVDGMRSHEFAAWRSDPANREDVAILDSLSGSTPGFKRIDLSAKPTERYGVVRRCVICQNDAVVASDFQGLVICSTTCQREYEKFENHVLDVQRKFADAEPSFYKCRHNANLIAEALQAKNLEWNHTNLRQVFAQLTAERKLLPVITLKQLQAMSAESYAERERLDPQLGGHKEAIEKKVLASESQKREMEWAHQGFELSPKIQAMKNAAQNEVRQAAAAYENRGQVRQYRNGVPVEAPATSQNVVYRNGRRMN